MKVRRINFHPDEYLAGVSGRLTTEEQGVYWMVCTLIYSRGEPIEDDHNWLAKQFADAHWRTIRSVIESLIRKGKIERIEGSDEVQRGGKDPAKGGSEGSQRGRKLYVRRCAEELQKTQQRVAKASAAGRQGGRPPNDPNGLGKGSGSGQALGRAAFHNAKPNHQPITNNHQPEEDGEEKAVLTPNQILERLIDAAEGNVVHNSERIEIIKPISDLIAMGSDLELDILPVIRSRIAPMSEPLKTWAAGWLRDAILEQTAKRRRARGSKPAAGSKPLVEMPAKPELETKDQRDKRWNTMLEQWWKHRAWSHLWGDNPESPNCEIPKEISEQFAIKHDIYMPGVKHVTRSEVMQRFAGMTAESDPNGQNSEEANS